MSIIDPGPYAPGLGDGQPGGLDGAYTLPGTGTSVPGGLECVFEYNGLFLNVQQNTDRYQITSIDGLSDPDIRDTRDVNTNSDGETPYNSFYGGRTIVISGTIRTYSIAKLRDMQNALRTAFSDLSTEYPFYFRTGNFETDHLLYCKKISSSSMTEQQSGMEVSRDFQISLRASNPRFLSYYQNFVDIYPTVPTTEAQQYLLASIVNSGNYKAQPIFRVYGPSTGSTFTNDQTGQSFSIGAIPYGYYYEFNMGSPPGNVKYLVDSDGNNVWNFLSDDSQYIDIMGVGPYQGTLYDGTNNIFYYGDATRVQVMWRNSWI
jgi:hypothetical protein